MAKKALTAIGIRNLRATAKRQEIPAGARGLYVVQQPSGRISYAVRFRIDGVPKKLTLDRGVTLAEARVAAAKVFADLERGVDPIASKRTAKQAKALADADTFQSIAGEYQKREGSKLRSAIWRRSVLERLVYPTLGAYPIGAIKRSDIVRLLDRIEGGELVRNGIRLKGGPVMADRTLSIVRRILNWHALRSDDFRSPIVRGMARTKDSDRARSRILSDDELRSIWRATEGAGPFDGLVRFLLLTGARRSEAAGLTWGEIDGADWCLPRDRNKTDHDLVRTLSAAAMAVIEAQPRIEGSRYVFTFNGRTEIGAFSWLRARLETASGVTGFTLHDLRRTARSLMSRAGVSADHAERCLGHVIPGVRGVYDRHLFHREKALAFEALAALIERIVNPPASNVTALRG
jgi:integrase